MRLRLALVALAVLTPAPAAHAVHIPWADPALPERVTCGGTGDGFALDALRGPAFAERGSDAPAQALREWIEEERRSPQGFVTRGFRVVRRSARKVLYVGGHGRDRTEVLVERFDDGHWAQTEYGGCEELGPVHATAVASPWRPDPAHPPSASSRRLRVLVNEDSCASGSRATGRILRPRVFVDRRRVVVTIFVRPPGVTSTCPSNPDTPYVLRLPVAVGSRTLLDGETVPARAVRPQP